VKRLAPVHAVLLALAVTPAAHAAEWRPHVHDAQVYAKQRRGSIAFHVRTPTRAWGWRASKTFPSASVLKPMLMVAYLQRRGVRGRSLTHEDRELLAPMIRRSDNAAASRVLGIVGTSGLRRVARRAHMKRFTPVTPIWGNSRITASDQTRFFLRIDRLVSPRHRDYVLDLLETIVPSQQWGIGRVRLPGWDVYFKGGWGSGTGAVDHQVALLTRGDERVSLAIMTVGDGTHAYGKETLRGIAKRLLRGLPRHGEVP
jgi:hypothetical protein